MVEMLKGIAASDGVAVAKAYLLVEQIYHLPKLMLKILMQNLLAWTML